MSQAKNNNRRKKKLPLLTRFLLIVGVTALCGLLAWAYSTFIAVSVYQSTARLEVDTALLEDSFWYANNNSAMDLCDYFRAELDDEATLLRAAEGAGLTLSAKDMVKRVSASTYWTTTFNLSGTGSTPEEALRVANAWAQAVNEAVAAKAGKTVADTASKLTEGTLSERPVSPNLTLNILVACLLGLLVSYAVFSQQPLFETIVTVVFVIFTLLCIFPFYYLFINTISDNSLVSAGLINFYPKGVHLTNYYNLRDVSDLGSSVIVTVARTILGTALMVVCSAWAGYLVTKTGMWRRKLWYRALVMTMYFNAGLIPWYTNMLMLGLTDNFLAYIIPGMIAPYNIILVKTYIESIPASLEESAIIDGAGTGTVFVKIIWPLSIPILATISIFGAVGNWNSFQDSLLLMTSRPDLYTLQHRLYTYLNQSTNLAAIMSSSSGATAQNVENMLSGKVIKYTISMVTIIPILLVYPFMQRFFVKGIMLGAVKG